MPIRIDLDDTLSKIREAERRLRDHKKETDRLRRLDRAGLLRYTITSEERARLRAAFFARGGTVTKVPPNAAHGSLVSPRWDLDRNTLIKNVREQVAAGRTLEAALSGTGLSPTEIQIELEENE